MDSEAMATSSEAVRRAMNYIDGELVEGTYSGYSSPMIYYLLDKFDHEIVEDYMCRNKLSDSYIDVIAYEDTDQGVFHLNVLKNHGCLEGDNVTERVKSILKSLQTKRGEFHVTRLQHTGPLWFLSCLEPNSEAVTDGIEYFLSEVVPNQSHYRLSILSLGILALSEVDYYEYRDELEEIATEVLSKAQDTFDTKQPYSGVRARELLIAIMALKRAPGEYRKFINSISNFLIANQSSSGYFFDDDSLISTTAYTLTLIAAGKGPKVPKYDVSWSKSLQAQQLARSKPIFIQTSPIDPSASYAAEIQSASEKLIRSANNCLRIDSLYIDMLFDDIIDRATLSPNLEIRVLTRGRDIKGNRKRIKKDVLNDLIEATEGDVKQHHRLHSRLVIADKDAMVVSSADLTRDQLRDQFNAGVFTKDSNAVEDAVEYFDKVWADASRVEHT